MNTGNGVHWYGRNGWHAANNPRDTHLMRWRDAFTTQAPKLKRMGIEVVNASQDSALRCFEIAGAEEALRAWNI